MKNKIILNATLIACLVLINVSCDSTDSDLKMRINRYYKLEQENNWKEAYYFRTPKFKNSIPAEMYAAGMEKFMDGWTLQDFEIRNVRYSRGKSFAEVEILFREQDASKTTSLNTQLTTWEKIDGAWYGRDVGDRQHLFLNAELKFERH
jgi:hypothetical protein